MEELIIIKPHHFLDIIKLYGAGMEWFIPDEKMGHDFYRIGNMILKNNKIKMKLTIDCDDICMPCKYYRNNQCIDKLTMIDGYTEKDTYNKILDKRIIDFFQLDLNRIYTAKDLCKIYLSNPAFIYEVWMEENDATTQKRHNFFINGGKKYIKSYS